MKLFQSLVDKYKASKQKSMDKKEFREELLKAVEDGKLTTEEIKNLDKKKAELGLTNDDIQGMRAEIYTSALEVAKADSQVTKEEEEELIKIQKFLGLSDDEISHDKKELARLRLLNEIQLGNMPAITRPSNVVLFKSEVAYWVEPSELAEEKVVRRRYEGGSHGVSLRVMKGVSVKSPFSYTTILNEHFAA